MSKNTNANANTSKRGKPSAAAELLAGAIAGLADASVTHPIDTIKTRLQLQTQANRRYNSAIHAVQTTIAQEGWRALYKGLGPVATGIMPKIAIRFTSFEQFKTLLSDENGKMSWQRNLLAGLGAGVVESVLIVTPIELLKIRLQAQAGTKRYQGQFHALRTIIREEGYLAIYQGIIPTTMRQSFQSGIKFCAYNEIKKWMQGGDPKKDLNTVQNLIGGALANSIGAVLNTPIDVVKTRIQKQMKFETQHHVATDFHTPRYKGTFDCFKRILLDEGPVALFKGVGPRVARLAPSGAIQFAVFEQVLSFLETLPALRH